MPEASGITFTGTINCQKCGVPFVPERSNQRYCIEHKERRGHSNLRQIRREGHVLDFKGIDGEGVGRGREHRYVLLGCDRKYVTWDAGVPDITAIFSFLYSQYLESPDSVFCGFYLSYDFNMWLRMLPRERAWMLLTEEGKARRKRKRGNHRLPPFPVEYQEWKFDMLGYKRFKLKPENGNGWMYINDAGSFFQTSFLNVINPARWAGNPVVTEEEYELIKRGKERRESAELDDEMIRYNLLENEILSRVLTRLNEGFTSAGVRLDKRQWFGPGQAAQKWMQIDRKLDTATRSVRNYSKSLYNAICASYYAGWFEIPAHGIVPGITYEYDINSAYPYAIARLPCCCGRWSHGKGRPRGNARVLRLCKVRVTGNDPVFGPMPYRCPDGRILRPHETTGWYWDHELRAARKAELISDITWYEYWDYEGCGHKPPLRGLAGLYDERLRIGKDTPQGKAYKLLYNSVYGKLAQSVGDPRYGNALYASLITSGCRTEILGAIATHPEKSRAVVMVATDAVYFTSPHPSLPISNKLGEWSSETHERLTLFKPGVYWNEETRKKIREGKDVSFKARGISSKDFADSIGIVDAEFARWSEMDGSGDRNWPQVRFRSGFSQVSITQALAWTKDKPHAYKFMAGLVSENRVLTQSSDPTNKRDPLSLYRDERGVWRTRPWRHRMWPESTPYSRRFGWEEPEAEFAEFATPDGSVLQSFRDVLGVG